MILHLAATLVLSLPAGQGAAPTTVCLRFEVGRETLYSILNEQTLALQDSKQPLRTVLGYSLRRKTLEIDRDRAVVRFVFARVIWSVVGASSNWSFDSAKEPTEEEPAHLMALRGVIGKSFTAHLDQRGNLLAVQGLRKLAGDAAGGQVARGNVDLTAVLGEQQLRNVLRGQFSWLPTGPVSAERTWSRTESLSLGILTLTRHNHLAITQATGDRLTITSTIELAGEPTKGIVQGSQRLNAVLLAGKPGLATIRFNTRTGLLESLDAQIAFQMRIEQTPLAGNRQPSSVVQSLSARTQVQLMAIDGQPLAAP